MMTRLFIDYSHRYLALSKRGVDRVVEEILHYAPEGGRRAGVECVPVVWLEEEGSHVRFVGNGQREGLMKRTGLLSYKLLGRTVYYLFPYFLYRALRALFHSVKYKTTNYEVIEFSKGDILFIPDANWWLPKAYTEYLRRLKKQGVRIAVLVYDLIPIYSPYYLELGIVAAFRDWATVVFPLADLFLTISNATKRELETFAREHGYQANAFTIPLGFDFSFESSPQKQKIREDLKGAFSGGATYLVVGSLEPRKNQETVLDAFEILWGRGSKAKLCLVGEVTPIMSEEFLQRIKTHPQWKKLLFLFPDLVDWELSYCYQNAKALITSSFYEGFDLPVVEALSYKLPVFASDIPSHREVGGGFLVYFDPSDADELVEPISKFEKNGITSAQKPAEKFKWVSWEESIDEMLGAIAGFSERGSRQRS